ncbi:MAG: AAC(3) family N-acetyltransferase [Dehalococcoidia bacterium]|nr:AAC(3) family N-acetyltransferase [Dehalococcoidia bacterium]
MGELGDALAKVEVGRGDVVLVHSDVRGLLKAGMYPIGILRELLGMVGSGSLLLPTFNFGWSDKAPNGEFDYYNTPSNMGVVSELARSAGFRTFHPMYSFALLGNGPEDGQGRFGLDYKCAFGAESTFATLREVGAKVVVIGLPWQHSMTLVHYVEELEGVDYRFHKAFAGRYTDEDERTTRREYSATVRRLDLGVRTFVDDCEKDALSEGVGRETWLGRTRITAVDVAPFVEWLRGKLKTNPGYLHKRDGAPDA